MSGTLKAWNETVEDLELLSRPSEARHCRILVKGKAQYINVPCEVVWWEGWDMPKKVSGL